LGQNRKTEKAFLLGLESNLLGGIRPKITVKLNTKVFFNQTKICSSFDPAVLSLADCMTVYYIGAKENG
jgi:hypothetical protein